MGETALVIEWGNLDRLFQSMQEVDSQSLKISNYFGDQVCNKAGFAYDACALRPIADKLDTLDGYFVDMRTVFQDRWEGVMAAIAVTAKDVDATDGVVDFDFRRYLGEMGPYVPQAFPSVQVDVESFPVTDISGLLEEPTEGGDQLDHHKDWESVAGGYDSCRDTINTAIDRINGLGAPGVHLPRLSDKSLQEHIVFPLSGNYRKIQGNAQACGHVSTAMSTWGGNFSALSGKLFMAMRGDVELSLVAHLNLYNLVMKSVGVCVSGGSAVFNSIAQMSETIAVAVEKALVVMGKTLLRVATKVTSRVLGLFGWLMLAKDLVSQGISAITDIVDDVRACIDIITACFDLVDSIKAWAEEQAAALEAFKGMVDAVATLPRAVTGGGLDDIPPVDLPGFESSLGTITYDFTGESGATDDLDDELSDLGKNYPSTAEPSTQEEYQPKDDEVIMAPGQLGSGEPSSSTGGGQPA